MIQRVRVMYGARWLRAAVSSAYPIQVLTVDGKGQGNGSVFAVPVRQGVPNFGTPNKE